MDRVCEPELMENPLQVKAYAEADFFDSDEAFVNRIQEILCGLHKSPDSETVIFDLGCGPGNITEKIASRWRSAQVVGIDGSQAMLAYAKRRQGVLSSEPGNLKVSYLLINISEIAKGSYGFESSADVVISNSLLHHLLDPNQFWKALKYLASPGAVFLLRDLRRPDSTQAAIDLQKRYLAKAAPILIRDYLASLHAAFTVDEVREQIQLAGLENLRVFEVDDRYLEVNGTI